MCPRNACIRRLIIVLHEAQNSVLAASQSDVTVKYDFVRPTGLI